MCPSRGNLPPRDLSYKSPPRRAQLASTPCLAFLLAILSLPPRYPQLIVSETPPRRVQAVSILNHEIYLHLVRHLNQVAVVQAWVAMDKSSPCPIVFLLVIAIANIPRFIYASTSTTKPSPWPQPHCPSLKIKFYLAQIHNFSSYLVHILHSQVQCLPVFVFCQWTLPCPHTQFQQ